MAWRAAVGDIIGILVIAPLVLLAVTYRPWPRLEPLVVGAVRGADLLARRRVRLPGRDRLSAVLSACSCRCSGSR